MTKTRDDQVAVKAAAWFKHNGRDVRPGDVLRLAAAEAADLVAINMATRAPGEPAAPARGSYADRALFSRRDAKQR